MSNSDWMRGNFKKTPGYVCPPGKKDFPNMSFHGPTVVKGYADGGQTLPPGRFASKEEEEKKDFLPSLGETLQSVALLALGKFAPFKADGGIVKHGRKDFPDMSFHKPSAVKGYADGKSVSDNGFFSTLLRRTSTKDTGQDPAPVEDRVKDKQESATKAQNTTNDLFNAMPRSKSDEKITTAPAVSTVSSEYRASKDSQDANADPDGKYTVQQYKDNKEKIDETNQRKANNDKKMKALDDDRAKREQDERDRLKAAKPAEAVDFASTPTANITQTAPAAAAPIVSSPVVTPASRPYVTQSTPAYASAGLASSASAPKVKLVGNRFVYPADKVIDPYNEKGSSGDGVKGYPLRDDDPRWKLPIPKN